MKLACPVCGTWTVTFGPAEGAGELPESVSGTCGRCGSRLVLTPTRHAVELAARRVAAAGHMAKVAGAARG